MFSRTSFNPTSFSPVSFNGLRVEVEIVERNTGGWEIPRKSEFPIGVIATAIVAALNVQ